MKSYSDQILSEIKSWAINEEKVSSLALVGSYATGRQTDASDIDLVVVSKSKGDLLRDRNWTNLFGKIKRKKLKIGENFLLFGFGIPTALRSSLV